MGTDIHFHVEKQTGPGRWIRAEDLLPNKYYRGGGSSEPEYVWDYWYSGRDYRLFAMLANVRNGFGFAGIPTGQAIEPIDEPRGLPKDVSPDTQSEADYWSADAHSHSYFTVRELLEVDWQQMITHFGYVTPNDFDRWRRLGSPEYPITGVHRSAYEIISHEEMAYLIDTYELPTNWNARKFREKHGWSKDINPVESFDIKYFTQVEWTETWAEAIEQEFPITILRMARLALTECGGDLDKVRCVFWFDN